MGTLGEACRRGVAVCCLPATLVVVDSIVHVLEDVEPGGANPDCTILTISLNMPTGSLLYDIGCANSIHFDFYHFNFVQKNLSTYHNWPCLVPRFQFYHRDDALEQRHSMLSWRAIKLLLYNYYKWPYQNECPYGYSGRPPRDSKDCDFSII